MRVAYEHSLNADGMLIHIADAERGGQYTCAGCGKQMVAVLGGKRSPHFRHYAAGDSANCSPMLVSYRMPKLAMIADWRAAKADGREYPIATPCENCQTDVRLLDATDFDHADEERELVEGTQSYAAFWGDILANYNYGLVRPDVVFWRARARMGIKIGGWWPTRRGRALYRKAGIEFYIVESRRKDRMRVNTYDGRTCEPCRKKAELIVRRLQEEEQRARERGEPLDGDGMAISGWDVFHSWVARSLWEMGVSQDNLFFRRLASKIEASEIKRVRYAARKHKQAVGDAQGWICPYCGRDVSGRNGAIDHKIPVSRGGTSELDNLAVLCRSCNTSKHDLTPEEYLAFKNRRVAKEDRQAAGDSQDWLCLYCSRDVGGRRGVVIRKFPVSWEESEVGNLAILCRSCKRTHGKS